MKISLDWLADYVTLPAPHELAKKLTFAGLEVEAISGVVAGRILESVKHPNADKLSVTKVDFGRGPVQIVCGAKNYKVGDIVPVATPGTVLPDGTEIKVSAIRGVESNGMLCSARELGQSQDHEGLLILPADTAIGSAVQSVTFEVNVTPNRPDALSHVGIAREVAVLMGATMKTPGKPLVEGAGQASSKITVRIDDPSRCLRYAARVIEGVKVQPSPEWMQRRLKDCGVRAINNLVDVTNYVMLEYGQPLHAFDLDKIAGAQIIVRLPKAGEKLKTLDGKERTLDADDLLICDRDQALALAGVMGGASSEVTDATTRVLLECATFHPPAVRRASKRHGLHTESSHRFERGTDVHAVPAIADRAAQLIAELGGGTVLAGRIDVYPKPVAPRAIMLRGGRAAEMLGVEIPAVESEKILAGLGFKRRPDGALEVPGWRVDVTGEEDLVEELARIRGYDQIPVRLPKGLGTMAPERVEVTAERRIRVALAGEGLDEVVNYSFVAPAELAAFNESAGIAVSNPLSIEQSIMRTTMYASLVPNVVRSARHQATGVRFYEWGRTYQPDLQGGKGAQPVAIETPQVAGAIWGLRSGERTWTSKDANVDFYDVKAAVEAVLASLHIEGTYVPLESAHYHPRASAEVRAGDVRLGSLGELHPRAAKRLDAPSGVFLFQLELEALLRVAKIVPKAVPLTPYPAVLRDVALVIPLELSSDAVRKIILEVGAPLIEEATIFDVYSGEQIAAGRKNVAFALRYRAKDRTLTDQEVKDAHEKIVVEVKQRVGADLRA